LNHGSIEKSETLPWHLNARILRVPFEPRDFTFEEPLFLVQQDFARLLQQAFALAPEAAPEIASDLSDTDSC
jgi:hypothetical protein